MEAAHNHLLKFYALPTTPRSWRVAITTNTSNPVETPFLEELQCPESELIDRAIALAKERGYTIDGWTFDVGAVM